jgi:hypothetical protein
MLDKGNNMRNAPMNTSGHGMDRKWVIERDTAGTRACAESMKIKMKVRGGTRLVLRIRAG